MIPDISSDGSLYVGAVYNVPYYGSTQRKGMIAKVQSDGTLDGQFGAGGVAILTMNTAAGSPAAVLGVSVTRDGKLLAGGYATQTNTLDYFALAKIRVSANRAYLTHDLQYNITASYDKNGEAYEYYTYSVTGIG